MQKKSNIVANWGFKCTPVILYRKIIIYSTLLETAIFCSHITPKQAISFSNIFFHSVENNQITFSLLVKLWLVTNKATVKPWILVWWVWGSALQSAWVYLHTVHDKNSGFLWIHKHLTNLFPDIHNLYIINIHRRRCTHKSLQPAGILCTYSLQNIGFQCLKPFVIGCSTEEYC